MKIRWGEIVEPLDDRDQCCAETDTKHQLMRKQGQVQSNRNASRRPNNNEKAWLG